MVTVIEIQKNEKKIQVLNMIQEAEKRIESHKQYALSDFRLHGQWGWHSQREQVNAAIKIRLTRYYKNLN